MNRYLIRGPLCYSEISREEAVALEVNTDFHSKRRNNAFGGVDYIFPYVPRHPECDAEFGLGHQHDPVECKRILRDMSPPYPGPMHDIPWGTPDSWIPDNPNEDGFCQADFI